MRFDLGHGLDLKFFRSNMKFAISQAINQIWSNCHEMKSKRFDWTLSNKCSHRVWPWPWIFKVKFWNSPISGIGGPIDNEQSGVIHDHDRDLFVTKMKCKQLPDSDQGDFRCRRAVDSVLLISIIGGFIRIWPSIPNQFVIASYLAVAEHQIVFSLHSVSCKKPPTSECIQFFFY